MPTSSKHFEVAALAFIRAQQKTHGERVENRQRVNGQPNGYRPITEDALQLEHAIAFVEAHSYVVTPPRQMTENELRAQVVASAGHGDDWNIGKHVRNFDPQIG